MSNNVNIVLLLFYAVDKHFALRGLYKPHIIFTRVVFPAPFNPTIATFSPLFILRKGYSVSFSAPSYL